MTIRALHVIDTCGAGGIETTFVNVLRSWHQRPAWAEHRVLARAGGVLAADLAAVSAGVTIAGDDAATAAGLAAGHDVIHFLFDRIAHRWLPEVIARSGAAVVYGKGYDLAGTFRLNGAGWPADASLMWGADHVTFTTAALAATYAAPASRTTVLGKAARVAPLLRLPLPSPQAADRIVCVANLHALKRLGDLIRAAARLRPTHPDLRLRFVGGDAGGEGDRLRRLAAECGIADACEWIGRRDDVAVDLAESRIFALPSGREGVPTAMLEAMAAARPVVVTDVGHVASVVRDRIDGYLVPVGAVDQLAARLDVLLSDRMHARAMGLAARVRAAAHDVDAVAERLKTVLVEAAASSAVMTELPVSLGMAG